MAFHLNAHCRDAHEAEGDAFSSVADDSTIAQLLGRRVGGANQRCPARACERGNPPRPARRRVGRKAVRSAGRASPPSASYGWRWGRPWRVLKGRAQVGPVRETSRGSSSAGRIAGRASRCTSEHLRRQTLGFSFFLASGYDATRCGGGSPGGSGRRSARHAREHGRSNGWRPSVDDIVASRR